MPIIDKPLNELYDYKGSNIKPTDFDHYWDSNIKELDTFHWNVSIKPAEFKVSFAECYHLEFTGIENTRVYAKLLKPKNYRGKIPAILDFHGYRMKSSDWSDYLNYVAAGYCIIAMDCRGQGGASEDSSKTTGPTIEGHIIRGLNEGKEKLAYRAIFLDTVQLARIVMGLEDIDSERVGVKGYSQGGALAITCAALEPSISFVAPVYPFLSDYKRVWDMDLDQQAYSELRTYFRNYDPMHIREREIFETLAYIDVTNLAARIKGKVLMTITLMDNICPPSTQFSIYNNIISEKELLIYHDYGHEHLPGIADKIFNFFMNM